MKKLVFLSFICILFLAKAAYAQDLIYLKTSESPIEGNVTEITDSKIKYKKHSNPDGPLYTTSKDEVSKIVFNNGEIEHFQPTITLQESKKLLASSRLFLSHTDVEDKRNTDGEGVLRIAENEFKNLTKCPLVASENEADFIVNIQIYKGTMGNRRAKFIIEHALSGEIVLESDWVRGKPNEFNGFSGTRRAITKIIKRDLYKAFPEISKK